MSGQRRRGGAEEPGIRATLSARLDRARELSPAAVDLVAGWPTLQQELRDGPLVSLDASRDRGRLTLDQVAAAAAGRLGAARGRLRRFARTHPPHRAVIGAWWRIAALWARANRRAAARAAWRLAGLVWRVTLIVAALGLAIAILGWLVANRTAVLAAFESVGRTFDALLREWL